MQTLCDAEPVQSAEGGSAMNDCQHTCANTLVHIYRCAAKEDETISNVLAIEIHEEVGKNKNTD